MIERLVSNNMYNVLNSCIDYTAVKFSSATVREREERVMPHPEGGGGHFHIMYAYWVCAARETPILRPPKFPFRSISFSQKTNKQKKIRSGASPLNICCRFKISLISTHSSPPMARMVHASPPPPPGGGVAAGVPARHTYQNLG